MILPINYLSLVIKLFSAPAFRSWAATIFAELKSETGQPTPEQYEWLEALAEAGQEVYLWRPSDSEPNGGIISEILR